VPADRILVLGPQLRRVRLADYHRMIEAGVFDEDERAELLEEDCLEVHRDPLPEQGRYGSVTRIDRVGAFTSASVAGVGFALGDLTA
jgi:hypothetical protein